MQVSTTTTNGAPRRTRRRVRVGGGDVTGRMQFLETRAARPTTHHPNPGQGLLERSPTAIFIMLFQPAPTAPESCIRSRMSRPAPDTHQYQQFRAPDRGLREHRTQQEQRRRTWTAPRRESVPLMADFSRRGSRLPHAVGHDGSISIRSPVLGASSSSARWCAAWTQQRHRQRASVHTFDRRKRADAAGPPGVSLSTLPTRRRQPSIEGSIRRLRAQRRRRHAERPRTRRCPTHEGGVRASSTSAAFDLRRLRPASRVDSAPEAVERLRRPRAPRRTISSDFAGEGVERWCPPNITGPGSGFMTNIVRALEARRAFQCAATRSARSSTSTTSRTRSTQRRQRDRQALH